MAFTNALVGLTTAFNSAVNVAESALSETTGGARGDYEVALHQRHTDQMTAVQAALESGTSQFHLSVADADLIRPGSQRDARNALLAASTAADTDLTDALNAADLALDGLLGAAELGYATSLAGAERGQATGYADSGATLATDGFTADAKLWRANGDRRGLQQRGGRGRGHACRGGRSRRGVRL